MPRENFETVRLSSCIIFGITERILINFGVEGRQVKMSIKFKETLNPPNLTSASHKAEVKLYRLPQKWLMV